MTMMNIPIDLEVYKALESKRISFNEAHNVILRRIVDVRGSLEIADSLRRSPSPRVSGHYVVELLGERLEVRSIRDALGEALKFIEQKKPGFFEKLTMRPTTKGRRIVARKREDIYTKSHLVGFAAPLTPGWFFDTNISRRACERYLAIAAMVAEIDIPRLHEDVS